MEGVRAVTWQGERGAGGGSPCSSLAIAGMGAGTMARGPLALDEERARVGRLACALTTVLMGVWTGTQWVAARLNDGPELGAPWCLVNEMKVYPPWQLFAWWVAFGAQAPRAFDVGGMIAASGGVAAALVTVLGRGDRHSASSTLHGSARWANSADVVRSEEHTSELKSLMRTSYAVFCLKKKKR